MEIEFGGAESFSRAQFVYHHAFAHFAEFYFLLGRANNIETWRRREGELDRYFLATEAGKIVGDANADFELVARRDHARHIRREHEIAAHRGRVLHDADLVRAHGHGHDAQLAVEIVGQGPAEFAAVLDIDDARPVGDRLLMLALERIEMAREQIVGVATWRRHADEFGELGQDQVENLAGLHVEHAFAEEKVERIAELVARDLQNSLIDRKYRDARGLGDLDLHLEHLARLDQGRRIQRQRIAARIAIHRERHHAVTQRTHEDFVRRRIAHELHVDVT